jgi:hypothetical protein
MYGPKATMFAELLVTCGGCRGASLGYTATRVITATCSRVEVLNEAEPIAAGQPDEVRREPAAAIAYLG